MFDYQSLYSVLQEQNKAAFADFLKNKIDHYFAGLNHGDVEKWQAAFNDLPDVTSQFFDFNNDSICIGQADEITAAQRSRLEQSLKAIMPWRKGPFTVFGLQIDSEWQCQMKWQRLQDTIHLQNKRVLDVGCGNGYYLYRMLGAGAKQVVGVDPMLRFSFQFAAMQKYLPKRIAEQAHILPLTLQELPRAESHIAMQFDTVFSMGVLYHRRDHIDHLQHLYECLVKAGELILETLIIDSDSEWGDLLVPAADKSRHKRYAQMGNVWNIPTIKLLQTWLASVGFRETRVINETITVNKEQRATDWMQFHSLNDFLDPNDSKKTIEGYPAPKRAILKCLK